MLNFFNKEKKELKRYERRAELIIEKFKQINEEINGGKIKEEKNEDSLFAFAMKAIEVKLGKTLFKSQIIAGLALSEGKSIEMKTGEGKTLAAVGAAVINSIQNKTQTYIVSTNSYLVKRDFELLKPVYELLGLSVGAPEIERTADSFKKDVIFTTHTFLGFRYLEDNLVKTKEQQMLNDITKAFVIIDEADSVLIDDARAPLVITGYGSNAKAENISKAFEVAKQLEKGEVQKNEKGKIISTTGDFYIEHDKPVLTEEGSVKAEQILEIDSLYDLDNAYLEHYTVQCLKALYTKHKDVNYIVQDGKIVLINESTGRLEPGLVLSEGMHQALELKEELKLTAEKQPIGSITFQNLFKLFGKTSGMSGTIDVEAVELREVYGMNLVRIPLNKEQRRVDHKDFVFLTKEFKKKEIISKVKSIHENGQPVLLGTVSVDQSNEYYNALKNEGIEAEILNAENHEKEAQILRDAGQINKVTVVTNMAGRGVDIIPSSEAINLGGLYVIGVERNQTRRLDNQLIGRAGRQGNPGQTQFYLSLEDQIFAQHAGKALDSLKSLNKEGAIESKIITNLVEKSQNTMDTIFFEMRRDVISYDDINRLQREQIFKYRNRILNKDYSILDSIEEYKELFIDTKIFDYVAHNIKQEKEIIAKNILENLKANPSSISEIEDEIFEDVKKSSVKNYLEAVIAKRVVEKIPQKDLKDFMLQVLLDVIDNETREFNYSIDMLMSGVNLRSYNNRNPIEEYKKESFHLFENLMKSIKINFIKTLATISIQES